MKDDQQHVLIIGFVWPEPNSSAAGKRMLELIHLFKDQGWNVTFASSAAETDHMSNLKAIGVDQVSIQMNSSTFDEFVRELNPSVVLFDRFVVEEQFGWRVAEQCPNALRILDTEDLHFLRRARKKAHNENRACTKEDLLSSKDAKREIASIFRSDLSLIISEAEMDLLREVFDVDPCLLQYLPFLLDPITEDAKNALPDFSERSDFVTIGNFRHSPNMDAVRYLKKKVWPLIRKQLPDVQLHIYGAYVTQEAEQMHNPEEGFYVKGRVKDAKQVVANAKVLLAPLRFGAGLKGKLIEAMQCGTPSVTTSIGAEGIVSSDENWGGIIAENSEDIASAAQHLYSDKKAWTEAQQKGFSILNKKFIEPDFDNQLIENIKRLRKDLPRHRAQNFIGQMLMHHTAESTKYMGRWIEAKNRNM
ncbi:glycosyltransferase [Fodinibius sp.]|uniref:glycosyltransferase n=1 Tax=Fodinibius sp. TaxID=1872440 RepID=UPI002ACDDD0B|nr:glycosyltransferase [Fodinibius sp.]MDZ7659278.1 glycosyltransferase [Fodinibius sp.]